MARLHLCEKLLVAMELAAYLNDTSFLLHAVVQAWRRRHLANTIDHVFFIIVTVAGGSFTPVWKAISCHGAGCLPERHRPPPAGRRPVLWSACTSPPLQITFTACRSGMIKSITAAAAAAVLLFFCVTGLFLELVQVLFACSKRTLDSCIFYKC